MDETHRKQQLWRCSLDLDEMLPLLRSEDKQKPNNPPVGDILGFLASVGNSYMDRRLAGATDPTHRADLEQEREGFQRTVGEWSKRLTGSGGQLDTPIDMRNLIHWAFMDWLETTTRKIESRQAYAAGWRESLAVGLDCGSVRNAEEAFLRAHDTELKKMKKLHADLLRYLIRNPFPIAYLRPSDVG